MWMGAIVVSQIGCVLLRNLLYFIATGFTIAFADNGEGALLGSINRRVKH